MSGNIDSKIAKKKELLADIDKYKKMITSSEYTLSFSLKESLMNFHARRISLHELLQVTGIKDLDQIEPTTNSEVAENAEIEIDYQTKINGLLASKNKLQEVSKGSLDELKAYRKESMEARRNFFLNNIADQLQRKLDKVGEELNSLTEPVGSLASLTEENTRLKGKLEEARKVKLAGQDELRKLYGVVKERKTLIAAQNSQRRAEEREMEEQKKKLMEMIISAEKGEEFSDTAEETVPEKERPALMAGQESEQAEEENQDQNQGTDAEKEEDEEAKKIQEHRNQMAENILASVKDKETFQCYKEMLLEYMNAAENKKKYLDNIEKEEMEENLIQVQNQDTSEKEMEEGREEEKAVLRQEDITIENSKNAADDSEDIEDACVDFEEDSEEDSERKFIREQMNKLIESILGGEHSEENQDTDEEEEGKKIIQEQLNKMIEKVFRTEDGEEDLITDVERQEEGGQIIREQLNKFIDSILGGKQSEENQDTDEEEEEGEKIIREQLNKMIERILGAVDNRNLGNQDTAVEKMEEGDEQIHEQNQDAAVEEEKEDKIILYEKNKLINSAEDNNEDHDETTNNLEDHHVVKLAENEDSDL